MCHVVEIFEQIKMNGNSGGVNGGVACGDAKNDMTTMNVDWEWEGPRVFPSLQKISIPVSREHQGYLSSNLSGDLSNYCS